MSSILQPTNDRRPRIRAAALRDTSYLTVLACIGAILFALAAATMLTVLPVRSAAVTQDSVRAQIETINAQVQDKRRDLTDLNRQIESYRRAVMEKRDLGTELQDQINLLETGIARTQLAIDITEQEIEALELEIAALNVRINEHEGRMTNDRALMAGLSRKLYHAQFNRTAFDALLAHNTFSGFFDEIREVADMQAGMQRTLVSLKGTHAALERERTDRGVVQLALADKRLALVEEREQLEDTRLLKDVVLAETQSSELRYRYMLAELQREQREADADIARLERALREKVDVTDRIGGGGGETVLSWPVDPSRGISARFQDPSYPFRHVYEHPAIDIRAYQGTPIRAPASGIVARARDAGYGYSYIMLIHNNDISTVFGHISKILVKEDTFVERGEVIGLSGGQPGTLGAGNMTTGPHLHFEVRKAGIPVDPLNYLVRF